MLDLDVLSAGEEGGSPLGAVGGRRGTCRRNYRSGARPLVARGRAPAQGCRRRVDAVAPHILGPMSYRLWTSSVAPRTLSPSETSPGEAWLEVGRVDATSEDQLRHAVQAAVGLRSTSRRRVEFYAQVDSGSQWLGPDGAPPAQPFYLALRIAHDSRYLIGTGPAITKSLARRPPEAHPGLIARPLVVGVALKAASAEPLFRKVQIG